VAIHVRKSYAPSFEHAPAHRSFRIPDKSACPSGDDRTLVERIKLWVKSAMVKVVVALICARHSRTQRLPQAPMRAMAM